MSEKTNGNLTSNGKTRGVRFTIVDQDGIASADFSGNHVGQVCHNHVLTEIYIDMENGHVTSVHAVDVGSC
jgi:hypothetical protein